MLRWKIDPIIMTLVRSFRYLNALIPSILTELVALRPFPFFTSFLSSAMLSPPFWAQCQFLTMMGAVDKICIGTAAVLGMRSDLGLVGQQYS
jgi:hypothetical protein